MYEFDLFVSYKREPPDQQLVTPWLREVLKRVTYWAGQNMNGKRPRVFFDEQSIEVGDAWPDEIKAALLSAKCLLPIWSPEYFQSAWCLAEWKSFLEREKLFMGRRHGACRLIIPIKIHDGKWFPQEAQRLTPLDLSRYAATTEAFWKTVRADELDQVLMDFAIKVAEFVRDAPDHEDGWPVDLPAPGGPPEDVEMVRL
jgi:hypothetical protein